jgi:hypothetical protein
MIPKPATGCYFCGKPTNSFDHVPPKAFFPEAKDMPPGYPDLRRNLITVRSCDAHNNRYSEDDEVAAHTVLLCEKANDVALQQSLTKTRRALERNPRLAGRVMLRLEEATKPDGTPGYLCTIDRDLLDRVMERIARGLHFHHFGKRWDVALNLGADGMAREDALAREIRLCKDAAATAQRQGSNPTVFWYQWIEVSPSRELVLRMVFYDGLEYFAFPSTLTGLNRPGRISAPQP